MEEIAIKTTLDVVADIAEFANAVASLLVGHRKILVEGGFTVEMADGMCYELHGKLLGLVHEPEDEIVHVLEFLTSEDDDDEE